MFSIIPKKCAPKQSKQVTEAIDKLGYAPKPKRPRACRRLEVAPLASILPQLNHGLYLQIATGATAQATKEGYSLLIASCVQDCTRIGTYRRYFAGTQMSGMLVANPTTELGVIANHDPIPTVYLDIWSERPGDYICADNAAEGRLMARASNNLGIERIAIIGRHPPKRACPYQRNPCLPRCSIPC